MSRLGRESSDRGGQPVPVLYYGTVTQITVATGSSFCYLEIGTNPTATVSGQRIRIVPGIPEYFGVNPLTDKVAAYSGASGAVSGFMGAYTTIIRVLYDSTAGVLEIMEGAK